MSHDASGESSISTSPWSSVLAAEPGFDVGLADGPDNVNDFHGCAMFLLAAGIPVRAIMDVLGHS